MVYGKMQESSLTRAVSELILSLSKSLAKRLNLKLGDKDEFMLVTFGSEKPKRTESRNSKLDIVLKDGSILTIDLFHIVFAHACIGHVTRYFSIIGETLHRWGKRILSH